METREEELTQEETPEVSNDRSIRSTDRTVVFNRAEVQTLEVLVIEAKDLTTEREGSIFEFFLLDHILTKLQKVL